MSYVTTLGAGTVVAQPSLMTTTSVPTKTPLPTKTITTTKPAPAPLPTSMTSVLRNTATAGRVRTTTPSPPVAPSIPDVSFPTGDSTRTLLVVGGAVTVGLLLVIALRK